MRWGRYGNFLYPPYLSLFIYLFLSEDENNINKRDEVGMRVIHLELAPLASLLWTPHFCACAPTRWWTYFFIWKRFYFLEKDLELPLIFVLFLKGKQNKKGNPKCDSLFGKYDMWKTKPGFGVRLFIRKIQ